MKKKNSLTLKEELNLIREHIDKTICDISAMMDNKINHSLALIDDKCLNDYRNLKEIKERLKEIL